MGRSGRAPEPFHRRPQHIAAVVLLGSLGTVACGPSSSGGATCDDPSPRVTGTPAITPSSVPFGSSGHVDFTVPVTRASHRVVVGIAKISGIMPDAVGITEQSHNDDAECSVTIGAELHVLLEKGKYFPEINIEPAPDAGLGFVHYTYFGGISATNYAIVAPPEPTKDSGPEDSGIEDSGIRIPFLSVE